MKSILLATLALGLLVTPALATPSVKASKYDVRFKELVNDDLVKSAEEQLAKAGYKEGGKLSFSLDKIDDASLVSFVKAFPKTRYLTISGDPKKLTSIAPLAGLSELKSLTLTAKAVSDMSPLAGLTMLTNIKLDYGDVASLLDLQWMKNLKNLSSISISSKGLSSLEGIPSFPAMKEIAFPYVKVKDFSPLASFDKLKKITLRYATVTDLSSLQKIPHLEEVNLYGAKVRDFSPLANCKELKRVCYYATEGADYSTLGTLTQVEELDGGLTKLDNIAWVSNLKNLKKLDVFAEYVTDYTPLAGASSLEKFKIWNMRVGVGDLGFLTKTPGLKELTLDSTRDAKNFAAIGSLKQLKKLTLSEINKKNAGPTLDLSFLSQLTELKELDLCRTEAVNANFTGMQKLRRLAMRSVCKEGGVPLDLATLKNLPALSVLILDDCVVTNFEALAQLPELYSVSLRNTKGIKDLSSLKKCGTVTRVTLSKGAFTPEQLKVLDGIKLDIY